MMYHQRLPAAVAVICCFGFGILLCAGLCMAGDGNPSSITTSSAGHIRMTPANRTDGLVLAPGVRVFGHTQAIEGNLDIVIDAQGQAHIKTSPSTKLFINNLDFDRVAGYESRLAAMENKLQENVPALEVTGAATPFVNGLYKRDGMSGRRPAFVKINANGTLYRSTSQSAAEHAHIWISFSRVPVLEQITGDDAMTGGDCGPCSSCGSCPGGCFSIQGSCARTEYVKTAELRSNGLWTIGDSEYVYYTSGSDGVGGYPPSLSSIWDLGPEGLPGSKPSLHFFD